MIHLTGKHKGKDKVAIEITDIAVNQQIYDWLKPLEKFTIDPDDE